MGNVQERAALSKGGGQITHTIAIPLDGFTITAAPPEMLSQYTVTAVCGVPKRTYLETIREPSFPLEVVKFGKLRLVSRVEFLAWLRTQNSAQRPANDVPTNDVGAVVAELGGERTGGRR